jgi:urease subunit gamma/beta
LAPWFLTIDDVMPGVAKPVGTLPVEAMFADGQKLVMVHDPIRLGREPLEEIEPGEIVTAEGGIELNQRRETSSQSLGDRPARHVQHVVAGRH